MEPTTRRGLLDAGAAAALGVAGVAAAPDAPAAARHIDPELTEYWSGLLRLLARHDAAFGPHQVLDTVQRELRRIAAYRQIARGDVRTELMRVEASWAGFAMWLSNDTGDVRGRDAWANRALRLAEEAGYPDMAAFVRSQQSQWALEELDARRATQFAEDALRIPGTSTQTRALCASWAARGSALARDALACERRLHDASGLADVADSPGPSWAGDVRIGHVYLRATEARCWLWMQPSRAIPLYEGILRAWPHDRMRTGGLHQARLALACAAAGERDRAEAEGRKALAIARSTNSAMVRRELKRLGKTLTAL